MASLADLVPEIAIFNQQRQQRQQGDLAQLQQVGALQGILAKDQARQEDMQTKELVAKSGGDPEKAMSAALAGGNIAAAAKLAPLVKLYQEQKQREQTVKGMRDLYAPQGSVPQGAPAAMTEDAAGNVSAQAPASATTPASPGGGARAARIEQLKKMSMMYAHIPAVAQRYAAEIDKLENQKPMVEHNYPIGDNQVQPHISHDNGQTWAPIPGSKPSAKFAKQAIAVGGGADNGVQPTDDTLQMDAWRYLTDGTMPPNMGRGKQGSAQSTKIRNMASSMAKEMGMSAEEIRFAQLTNKEQLKAIGQLGRARAQILQAEKLASENATLALEASSKVTRAGVPLLNKGIQWAQENLAGDPLLRQFTIANETFISEYAKVMGGGYGAAAPTEGAQARAHQLLNRATTQKEYEAGVAQLRREMKNREKSLNDQMDEERRRLRGGIGKPPITPTPSDTPPNSGGWKITPVTQ